MLIDGPIPSKVTDEMRVTFLPQFLGTFPRALSPFGALAYLGVRATLVEDSFTNTSRPGSTPFRRWRKALLFSSSRSVAASVFFVAPPQLPSYGPAHGRDGHPNARLLLPQLAVALQGGVVVRFKLLPQEPLLFGAREDAPPPPRGEPGREVLAFPLHLDPALEGGKGDGEDLNDLLPRDAPLDSLNGPDP